MLLEYWGFNDKLLGLLTPYYKDFSSIFVFMPLELLTLSKSF